MNKLLRLLLLLAGASACYAQTWFPVATEGNTSVTVPAGSYRFGTNSCSATNGAAWASFTLKAQQTFSMYWDPWPWPVADPCVNVTKELDIAETATAQTLTVGGTTVTVPAITGAASCTPADQLQLPSIPATYPGCTLAANAVQVAVDGQKVTVLSMGAPIWFQYCWGTVCTQPQPFWRNRITVQANSSWLGGSPAAGTGTGALYAIESTRPAAMTITAVDGTATNITVPPTPNSN